MAMAAEKVIRYMNWKKFIIILNLTIAGVFCYHFPFCQNQQLAGDCLLCHEKVYHSGMSNFYIHAPFDEKNVANATWRKKLLGEEAILIKIKSLSLWF